MQPSPHRGPSRTLTNRLVQVMRQHPLVCFYLMAFGWTWLVDLLILSLWHQPSGEVGDALRIIIPAVIGAPTYPAFLMTALTEGRAGMGRLLRRYVLWRVGVRWYLFVLIGFPALILLSLLVPPGGIVALREPVPALVLSYLPVFIVIFLVAGPLPEEAGWRGFALPRLEQRLGPLGGTLLLGLLWGLWHFPLFLFIPGFNGAGTGFVGISLPFVEFVIGTVALAVIFTWVFNNTHGSLLLTMLLHTSENTVFGMVFETQVGYLSVYLVYIVMAVLITIATRGHLSYERYQREMMCSVPGAVVEQQPGRADTSDDGFHKP
jgi:membrane protease YdiL (CAAX protease family)